MKILILIFIAMMIYGAIQQHKENQNCQAWESHKVMAYDPVLKMIRPITIFNCIKETEHE